MQPALPTLNTFARMHLQHTQDSVRFAVTFALAIEIEIVACTLAPQMKGVEPSSTGSEAQVVLSVTLETSQNTVFPAVQLT